MTTITVQSCKDILGMVECPRCKRWTFNDGPACWRYQRVLIDEYPTHEFTKEIINMESNGGDVANYLNPFDYGLIREKNTDMDLLARLVRYIGGEDQFKRIGLYSGDSITSERLIQLKNEMAEFSFVNSVLSCLRINYAPTTGSGGQDDNSNMFPIVFKKFAEISDRDSHKYDEL